MENGAQNPNGLEPQVVIPPPEAQQPIEKGKGKMPEPDAMEEDEEESEEDEEVSFTLDLLCKTIANRSRRSKEKVRTLYKATAAQEHWLTSHFEAEPEEPDEDNMEEIDMDNIVGTRTRGKNIDYAEAAKQLGEEDDDDDEEDEDFMDEDDKMEE
jgi:hypothetical protein